MDDKMEVAIPVLQILDALFPPMGLQQTFIDVNEAQVVAESVSRATTVMLSTFTYICVHTIITRVVAPIYMEFVGNSDIINVLNSCLSIHTV